MRIVVEDTKKFLITMDLHQGSLLNLYLFTLVLDVLTNTIQYEVPWYMLFIENETGVGVNQKHELWRLKVLGLVEIRLNTCTAGLVSMRKAKLRLD